ncbi:GNAT family N-acetyltransferase [Oceanobacillus arenosus]|uniref:GNAT family N-acetyltransferase n=1 Tax=Oceanobacillus arenosus TaxID=1229153 RepID=A0A3D8PYS4_9BACI|nr:GNAT family N-acetyltransferase [Oceanobacillus arenosus]RDW20319.1 GNAT family N-acetyltransferase [Oceanobacillus arenosus]
MTAINKGENKFYIGDDIRNPIAEMTFVQSGVKRIVIDHTYVTEELRGQGVASELLEQVVLFAREEKLRILPLCPYAKHKLENNEAYLDILSV